MHEQDAHLFKITPRLIAYCLKSMFKFRELHDLQTGSLRTRVALSSCEHKLTELSIYMEKVYIFQVNFIKSTEFSVNYGERQSIEKSRQNGLEVHCKDKDEEAAYTASSNIVILGLNQLYVATGLYRKEAADNFEHLQKKFNAQFKYSLKSSKNQFNSNPQ
ncbi:hypothetical protein ACU8KH_00005 [Lachancea thermotolerans]